MSFLDKLRKLFFGSADSQLRDPDGIYFYVKCDTCGAPVRIRADKHHDLQRNFEHGGYTLRKEIMDGGCFSLIYATLRFDEAYRIVEREIEGGTFITWEEYQVLTQPVAAKTQV
ncbi:MAG: hypothetical protein JXR84_16390 [Anaerolineae bacterium]|nr:hypothetical protein [Anaerolineae bacterium]